MATSFPPLPDELAAFVQGGVSLLVSTCSKALEPEPVRASGLRVLPGACHLTVLLPRAVCDVAIANLRENPRIAVAACQLETYRTVQMKGTVVEIREGNEDDRRRGEAYGVLVRRSFAHIGIPEGVMRGLAMWPAWAVDVEILHVFAQTPGPKAGERMPLAPGANLP